MRGISATHNSRRLRDCLIDNVSMNTARFLFVFLWFECWGLPNRSKNQENAKRSLHLILEHVVFSLPNPSMHENAWRVVTAKPSPCISHDFGSSRFLSTHFRKNENDILYMFCDSGTCRPSPPVLLNHANKQHSMPFLQCYKGPRPPAPASQTIKN